MDPVELYFILALSILGSVILLWTLYCLIFKCGCCLSFNCRLCTKLYSIYYHQMGRLQDAGLACPCSHPDDSSTSMPKSNHYSWTQRSWTKKEKRIALHQHNHPPVIVKMPDLVSPIQLNRIVYNDVQLEGVPADPSTNLSPSPENAHPK